MTIDGRDWFVDPKYQNNQLVQFGLHSVDDMPYRGVIIGKASNGPVSVYVIFPTSEIKGLEYSTVSVPHYLIKGIT